MNRYSPSFLSRFTKSKFGAVSILIGLFVIFGGIAEHGASRTAFTSPEVKFADATSHGLRIVPASCPSTPHYAGQCDTTTPPQSGRCKLIATPYAISPGENTTLSWIFDAKYPFSSIQGTIAPISATVSGLTGSITVAPSVTTSYQYTGVEYAFGFMRVQSEWCTVQVTVADQACPIGYARQGNQCVLSRCPSGYTMQNSRCVRTACPVGYTLKNGQCVNQCGAQFFCQNNDLYIREANCNASLYSRCSNGCAAGACLPTPAPEIVTWTARPALVRNGASSEVVWQAQHVASCTVTGTNGDSWSGASGDKTSGPITSRTTFTLTCKALPTVTPDTVIQTAVVNVAPTYNER